MKEIRPLRAYAEVVLGRQRSPQHETGTHMVPYLRAANVKDGVLDLSDVKEMNFTPAEQQIFSLRGGDVLVTEGSGSLRSVGATAVWSGEIEGTVCSQNTLLRLRPRPGADPRFLAWWCRYAFADGLFASVAMGANIFHLSAERVRSLPLRYISLSAQRAIADYLDRETARIDALIEKKQRLVRLLEERFWSALVLRIKQTDSVQVPLRRVIVRIVDGPFGSSLTSSHYSDEGARVVRLGNIGLAEFRHEDEAYIPRTHYSELVRHRVMPGDLLIAGLGDSTSHTGRACIAPDLGDAIVKADCYCTKVDERQCIPAYLAYYLSSPFGASSVALSTRGTTRARINLDIAKDIPIDLVPLPAQAQICKWADAERQGIRHLRDALRAQLDLLVEHRQALITAAVTGDLAVPGVTT